MSIINKLLAEFSVNPDNNAVEINDIIDNTGAKGNKSIDVKKLTSLDDFKLNTLKSIPSFRMNNADTSDDNSLLVDIAKREGEDPAAADGQGQGTVGVDDQGKYKGGRRRNKHKSRKVKKSKKVRGGKRASRKA